MNTVKLFKTHEKTEVLEVKTLEKTEVLEFIKGSILSLDTLDFHVARFLALVFDQTEDAEEYDDDEKYSWCSQLIKKYSDALEDGEYLAELDRIFNLHLDEKFEKGLDLAGEAHYFLNHNNLEQLFDIE